MHIGAAHRELSRYFGRLHWRRRLFGWIVIRVCVRISTPRSVRHGFNTILLKTHFVCNMWLPQACQDISRVMTRPADHVKSFSNLIGRVGSSRARRFLNGAESGGVTPTPPDP